MRRLPPFTSSLLTNLMAYTPFASRAAAGPASISGRRPHAGNLATSRRCFSSRSSTPTTTTTHITTRSYKESRSTIDPLTELIPDPGAAAAAVARNSTTSTVWPAGALDGPLTHDAPVVTPAAARAPPHAAAPRGGLAWPRALKGSLTAVHNLAFHRSPPEEVAARPSRFPFSGEFSTVAAGRGGGGGGSGGSHTHHPASSSRPLSTAQVHSLLSYAGLVDPDRLAKMREVAARRSFTVVPVIYGSFDRGNLGAACRSAEAFGFGSVWVAEPATERYRPTRGRCSMGSEKHLDIRVFETASSCVAAARGAGLRLAVAVGPGEGVVPIEGVDWTVPTAIVLGNEKAGVSPDLVATADLRVTIPMAGFVESFNVSVAAALILSTARRALDAAAGGGGGGEEGGGAAKAGRLSEAEVETLAAAMLLRHKVKALGKWNGAVLEGLLARQAAEGEGDGV